MSAHISSAVTDYRYTQANTRSDPKIPADLPASTDLMRAALEYAAAGVPVFPLRPGEKRPLEGSRGFHDATTDEARIREWWGNCPRFNIGIPTGKQTGLLVLDVDHPAGLLALENERDKLPETRSHGTGSGGMHYLFEYPAGETVKSSTGDHNGLGKGFDIRADGGYIVAPPSRTTRPYELLDPFDVAAPPAWLLEALRPRQRPVSGDVQSVRRRTDLFDGGPIPDGQRNQTLFEIGCSLRARGFSPDEIAAELLEINAARCEPPKPDGDVEYIARKLAARYEPGSSKPGPDTETLEALEEIAGILEAREWPGMGGGTDRDVVVTLIKIGREHGRLIPAGVRVPVSVRELALRSGASKRSLMDNNRRGERRPGSISRLKAAGILRSDNGSRRGGDAGAFVLLIPRADVHHSTTTEHLRTTEVAYGAHLRAPLSAPRLRWSAPEIRRLGKKCGAVVDALEAAGGELELGELAAALNVSRPRDLRRRYITRLEAAAVVECSGDTVALAADWLEALNREREAAGELAAARRDMRHYADEQRAYANRRKNRSDPHPANVGADGFIEDLEPAPEIPDSYTLTGLIGTRVDTPRGPGILLDHKGNEARVILDADQSRWIPVPLDRVDFERGEIAA